MASFRFTVLLCASRFLSAAHRVVHDVGVTKTALSQLSLVHSDPSDTSPSPRGEDRRWALHSLVSHYIYANDSKIRGNQGASFPVSIN